MDITEFVTRAGAVNCLGVVVSQGGEECARHLWEPVERRNVYSISKSVTSLAVGMAESEGLLALDERLVDAFPDDLPAHVSDNLAAARVRDLLTMQLGQGRPYMLSVDKFSYESPDWVRLSLAQPFVNKPGSTFLYNNVGAYLAGILVQRRAGTDLVSYLMPRLFEPLGMYRPTWEVDALGNTFGAAGLMLGLDELHRLGQMLLQRGRWEGRQLVPESWVERACVKQVDSTRDVYGYGYLFWRGAHDSFYGWGKHGQFVVVYPHRDAHVSVVSESRQDGTILKAVHECIWPQL